jgi:hypothetical protein
VPSTKRAYIAHILALTTKRRLHKTPSSAKSTEGRTMKLHKMMHIDHLYRFMFLDVSVNMFKPNGSDFYPTSTQAILHLPYTRIRHGVPLPPL